MRTLLSFALVTLTCQAQLLKVDQSFVPPEDVVRLDTQIGWPPFRAGAQTFTPSVTGLLEGFDFWVVAIGGGPLNNNLRLDLQTTTLQGKPSGTTLGTVIIPPSFLDDQTGIYKHVSLESENIFLRAGERYAAVFQAIPYSSGGDAAYDFRGFSRDFGDYSYEPGQGFFTEDGLYWRDYAGPEFDYVFQSYMLIPEPHPARLIICTGLLLVFAKRRF